MDWKDLTDAVGLAAWGLGKYKEDLKRGRKMTIEAVDEEARIVTKERIKQYAASRQKEGVE